MKTICDFIIVLCFAGFFLVPLNVCCSEQIQLYVDKVGEITEQQKKEIQESNVSNNIPQKVIDSKSSESLKKYQPNFIAHFNESISVDAPPELSFINFGGEIIPDGVSGGALRLNDGEYLSIDAKSVLDHQEGTVIFWVRPHWDYNANVSHTFLSHGWADNRNGYFVLSDGWWESGGGGPFTYLVFNNQEHMHGRKVINYKKDEWICVAYTWKKGENSFVKLFVNNSLGKKIQKVPVKQFKPKGKLYLGSDKGGGASKNRWGNCDIDEFAVLDRALTHEEISSVYNSLKPEKNSRIMPKRGFNQQDYQVDQKADFVAHFDKTISVDVPENLSFNIAGGEIIPKGIVGNALRLKNGEYLSIDADSVLNKNEGTVMFWVRPHWNHDPNISHTFLSHKWADNRDGYFVLSDGWWEKGGGGQFTYLIYNNQDHTHGRKIVNYEQGEWTCLTYTWKHGEHSSVNLFINNSLASELKNISGEQYNPIGKLYLGSDKGSPLGRDRWGDCDIDEFSVFNRALTSSEIASRYNTIISGEAANKNDDSLYKSTIVSNQTRAIFDERASWTKKNTALKIIQRIKKTGFNVYIPCVWHGRGTRYYSDIAPMESNMDPGAEDPLKFMISLAHENDIEVHPWFTVALRRQEFFDQFYDPGTPKSAFDLHKKEFRDFISSLIMEVVEKYDIDGINLDFIRTMGICKSDSCIQDYYQKYGRDLLTDISYKSKSGYLEPHIQAWQNEAVESIVRDVSIKAKRAKPELLISVDGAPYPHAIDFNRQGRQEIVWANKNYIDIIYHMDYDLPPDFERMQMAQEMMFDKNKLIPILGNYEYDLQGKLMSRNPDLLNLIVNESLLKFPNGIGIYWYPSLSDEQINMFTEGPFSTISDDN